MKDSGRGVSGGFRRGRLRNALVIVELALSLVLLTGAGVMMRTLSRCRPWTWDSIRTTFWWRDCHFPRGNTRPPAEKQRFFSQLLPEIEGAARSGGCH